MHAVWGWDAGTSRCWRASSSASHSRSASFFCAALAAAAAAASLHSTSGHCRSPKAARMPCATWPAESLPLILLDDCLRSHNLPHDATRYREGTRPPQEAVRSKGHRTRPVQPVALCSGAVLDATLALRLQLRLQLVPALLQRRGGRLQPRRLRLSTA